jgi:hypothetical protein
MEVWVMWDLNIINIMMLWCVQVKFQVRNNSNKNDDIWKLMTLFWEGQGWKVLIVWWFAPVLAMTSRVRNNSNKNDGIWKLMILRRAGVEFFKVYEWFAQVFAMTFRVPLSLWTENEKNKIYTLNSVTKGGLGTCRSLVQIQFWKNNNSGFGFNIENQTQF